MKQYYPSTGIGKLCGLFGKTRQAYYDYYWRSADEAFDEAIIIDSVKCIRSSVPGIGGLKLHMMIKEELKLHNIAIGRDSFFALLKEHNLLIRRKKRYVQTTWSRHHYYKWPDLIRDLMINAVEQLWVSDITYLRLINGFVYLSLITDAYSRKIVGYHLSQQLKAQGCLIALNKALSTLSSRLNRKLIHHSDRGIQYCCEPYVSALQAERIQISMTQSGSPYDNAIAERVNGILKHQLGLDITFGSYAEAVAAVSRAVDAYNRIRPHMSVSNLTPQKAHVSKQPLVKTWKKEN